MKTLNEAAKKLGAQGGKKTRELYGSDHFKNISKKGLETRWGKRAVKRVNNVREK